MLKSLQKLQLRDLLASLESINVKPATMLLALGGILVVAYIVVIASCAMERRDQSGLKQQIEAGGGTLSEVGDSQETVAELEDRLSQVNADLDNLQHAFPTKLDSTAIVQSLFDYASQSHVGIKQMNALPASQVKAPGEKGEETSYTVLKYTLVVDGELTDVLAFLSLVEDGTAQTAAIGDATLEEAENEKEMTLGVTFYARSEDAPAVGATPGPTSAPAANQSKSN